jgi:hypothetical protein
MRAEAAAISSGLTSSPRRMRAMSSGGTRILRTLVWKPGATLLGLAEYGNGASDAHPLCRFHGLVVSAQDTTCERSSQKRAEQREY